MEVMPVEGDLTPDEIQRLHKLFDTRTQHGYYFEAQERPLEILSFKPTPASKAERFCIWALWTGTSFAVTLLTMIGFLAVFDIALGWPVGFSAVVLLSDLAACGYIAIPMTARTVRRE